MQNVSGWVIDIKKSAKGYWFTIFSDNGMVSFFSHNLSVVLFDKIDVVLSCSGNSLFLKDFYIEEYSFLRKNPSKLMLASYTSFLAGHFYHCDTREKSFFSTVIPILSATATTKEHIDFIERLWLETMGIKPALENEENYEAIKEFVGKDIPVRHLLAKDIIKKEGEKKHGTA